MIRSFWLPLFYSVALSFKYTAKSPIQSLTLLGARRLIFDDLLSQGRLKNNFTAAVLYSEQLLGSDLNLSEVEYLGIIRTFGESNQLGRALNVLKLMKDGNISPNVFHISSLIQACRRVGQWEIAIEIFKKMPSMDLIPNTVVYNSLLATLADANQTSLALELLESMTMEKISKDSFTYLSIIRCCGRSGLWKNAISLFESMRSEGITQNTIVLNAVLNACANNREWKSAWDIFSNTGVYKVSRDKISYSILLTALGNAFQFDKALSIFHSMDGALSNTTDDKLVPNDRVSRDTGVYNAMLTVCLRCGRWKEALHLLDCMGQGNTTTLDMVRIRPDVRSFSTTITCCGNVGRWQESLAVFNRMDMEGVRKDRVAYNAVIGALQTAGQWQEAYRIREAAKSAPVDQQRDSQQLLSSDIDVVGPMTSAMIFPSEVLSSSFLSGDAVSSESRAAVQSLESADTDTERDREGGAYTEIVSPTELFFLAQEIYSVAVAEGTLSHWVPSVYLNSRSEVSGPAVGPTRQPQEQNNVRVMDLHGFPCAVARTALDFALQEIFLAARRARGVASSASSSCVLEKNQDGIDGPAATIPSFDSTSNTRKISNNSNVRMSNNIRTNNTDSSNSNSNSNSSSRDRSHEGNPTSVPSVDALVSSVSPLKTKKKSWRPSYMDKPAPPSTASSASSLTTQHEAQQGFDLVIITGRGNHINSRGNQRVMRAEIEAHLSDKYPSLRIRAMPVGSNDGCIIISRESLGAWVESKYEK